MRQVLVLLPFVVLALATARVPEASYETDSFDTPAGALTITFFGHASLMLHCGATVVYVDPVSDYADYATMPKADIILVTHEHTDHLDPRAIAAIRTGRTVVITSALAAQKVPGAIVLANGGSHAVPGLQIEAVPAYNLAKAYHPKGQGNGYVLTFGGKRIYIAGDTENVPEVKALEHIDIAFLPMNLPYTMTPEQVADAARAIAPKVLYPYHFGSTDTSRIVSLLAGTPGIEVRIRRMK